VLGAREGGGTGVGLREGGRFSLGNSTPPTLEVHAGVIPEDDHALGRRSVVAGEFSLHVCNGVGRT
jgi:hypothetical protein